MCGDSPGGEDTYKEQVCIPLNGKVVCIDKCIHHIVAALNAGGVRTFACCCGHGKMIGNIVLEDGRWIAIVGSEEEWKAANDAVRNLKNKSDFICSECIHWVPGIACLIGQDHSYCAAAHHVIRDKNEESQQ